MKKLLLLSFAFLLTSFLVIGQDEPAVDKPVRDVFAANMLIDQQTTTGATQGGFEFIIQHRFGMIKELSDLYGLYAPSNIRMGFNYGLTENLTVGIGTEKNSKMQDISLKYALLKQSRSGRIPISISYYLNCGIDARSEETFGQDYKFADRLSYFNQLIISRKFSESVSMQVAPSFTHVNKVDSINQNNILGLSVSGRAKLYNEVSLMCEYHHPFYYDYQALHQATRIPNLGLGLEFATSTHAFQVFATTDDRIINQKTYLSNNMDFTKGDFMFGFNITVRF